VILHDLNLNHQSMKI